jgi:hypothetical protein
MVSLRRTATTAGIRRAFLFGALITLLGLAVSTQLPMRPKEHSRYD